MQEENLIQKAQRAADEKKASQQVKSTKEPVAGSNEFKSTKASQQVSQNAADADINKRDKTVLNSVMESLTKIAEELRIAAAKLAGNVDQTTLDRLDVVGQQLDSIK